MADTKTKAAPFVNPLVSNERPETLPANRSLTVVRSNGKPIPEFRRVNPYPGKVYRFNQICDVVAETLEAAVKSTPELFRHPVWKIEFWFGDDRSIVSLYPLERYKTRFFGFGRTEEIFSNCAVAEIAVPHKHDEDCEYETCPCTCGREEAHALSSEFQNPEIQQVFLTALNAARKKKLLGYAIDTHTYRDVRTGKRQNEQFKR